MPQRELNKQANERCKHQRHTGCSIYSRRPMSCVLWSCRWLTKQDTDQLSRPDISHYVVDIMPDFVTAIDDVTGARAQVPVIQVWVDPRYPDAHRDPQLRAYLQRRGLDEGAAAIIRYSSSEGFVLFPPALTGKGWIENRDGIRGEEHSAAERLAAIPSHFVEALKSNPFEENAK